MATFTKADQSNHRKAFIEECRQKAWGAACHADWVSKGIDELMVSFKELQDEDRTLEADIKDASNAIDFHTVDNREKRKGMQERRNQLATEMQLTADNAQRGHQAMQNLLQSAESNLQLAEHAEKWEWKEVDTAALADKVDDRVEDVEIAGMRPAPHHTLKEEGEAGDASGLRS